jgi:MYXO-CTERM domain-containing protein
MRARPATWISSVALGAAITAGCGLGEGGGEGGERLEAERLPIIGGFETFTDPQVVFTSTTTGQCTGTLIAPEVVLTAAHCIYDSIQQGRKSTGSVSFGDSLGSFDQVIGIADMIAHRYYSPAAIRRFDIGLIRLQQAPEGIEPIPLGTEPLDESLLGAGVRVLGFGVTDGETQTGAGTKRQVNLTIDEITGEHVGLGDLNRNICQGDSGGPTLLVRDGVESVIAVSSFGSNFCQDRSYVTRTDAYADFLAEVVAAWSGPCKHDSMCGTDDCGEFPDPDCDLCGLNGICATGCPRLDLDCPVAGFEGDRCEDNDGCESRVCVAALDDPRIKYCSRRCDPADPQACSVPLVSCQPDEGGDHACYYGGITPGAQGAPCSSGADCRSGACDGDHQICIEQCGDGLPACPEPYSCESVGGGARACTLSGGGCSAAAGAGGTAAALGAALLLLIILLRRRDPCD